MTQEDVQAALERIFGFRTFRGRQEEVVRALLAGRDAFVVMPTGGGKSLCYQLPAVLLPGTALLISPLIALMKDQVDAARTLGIRASYLNSSVSAAERHWILENLTRSEPPTAVAAPSAGGTEVDERARPANAGQTALDLLYVAPERFADEAFLELLSKASLSFIGIDEAHCISEWGHDFRPDYLRLSELAERFPEVPIAAFTATATLEVQSDILSRLRLRRPLVVRASFDRPNLHFRVVQKQKIEQQILDFVGAHRGEPGIIYRSTRKGVDRTAHNLAKAGFGVVAYHAGMSDEDRRRNQDRFRADEAEIVVATVAFGMGIDKPNVRYVLHGDLPKSLESYYQEAGRAGRDGGDAECVLYFGPGDLRTARYFIDEISDRRHADRARRSLTSMVRYAGALTCRVNMILQYFGEAGTELGGCGHCDVCTGNVIAEDATRLAQMLLSAVYRTGGRFGAKHIMDVVTGIDTPMVRRHGHDRLPTFGVASGENTQALRDVLDNLISQGVCHQETGRFPVLSLTEAARPILAGQTAFRIPKRVRRSAKQPGTERGGSPTGATALTPELEPDGVSDALFLRLRNLRAAIAREAGIPAYLVFPDKSLRQMATDRPRTTDELREIHGVGDTKLRRYGRRFLDVLTDPDIDAHASRRD